MKRLLLFGAVATFAATAAAEPPPGKPLQALDWPSFIDKEPTKGITLGTFHVQFEATTLSDVQQAASGGTITQGGDAGEHILWLCYTAIRQGTVDRIWPISDGEMGGYTHLVTAIAARRLRSAPTSVDCPSLPTAMQPASLEGGVWLGSSDAQRVRILGPSHNVGGWNAYRYVGKVPGKCEGGYDVTNWLATKSTQGHITAISAGRVTSC